MACGCAARMRKILKTAGYRLEDGIWSKDEHDREFPDARIEEDHFRVLIETLSDQIFGRRANNFMRRIGG